MNTAPARSDIRTDVTTAQQWTATLLAGVTDEQWGLPTPCSEFDVEALTKHLFGVAHRLVAMGGGAPADSVPATVDTLPTDVVASYRDLIEQGRAAWQDDASLGRIVEAPFGAVPGTVVASVYLAEVLTHGWDLAVATGQDSEADPQLSEAALATMAQVLPATGRDGFPFDDAVESRADAGPTERLANWSGRPGVEARREA